VTPDKPFAIAVALICSTLCCVLPARFAILPLALAISMFPNTLLLPPDNLGLTPQRVIAFVLFLRCLVTPALRARWKWDWVNKAAVLYFLLVTAAHISSKGLSTGINNRGGFFLQMMVPFWCVRLLVVDRQTLFILLKGWLWGALLIALSGLYQFKVGDHPYYELMRYGVPKLAPETQNRLIDRRMMFGEFHNRVNVPFVHSIMFGWFFALLMSWSTSLYWEKKKFFPWIIPWVVALPLGTCIAISGGAMMLAAMSLGFLALFPFRKYWRGTVIASAVLAVAFSLASNRNILEVMANSGFDAGSSWYRVGLNRMALEGGMSGRWLTGYGDVWPIIKYHDLCIHWVSIVVWHGLMGLFGFYSLLGVCAWQLWNAKKKASGVADEWILWSLLSAFIASQWAMLVVALFGEMNVIYMMFMAVMANAPLFVGTTSRRVGVMAEMDGRPVMLVYTLKPGQTLAMITPAAAGEALGDEKKEKKRSGGAAAQT